MFRLATRSYKLRAFESDPPAFQSELNKKKTPITRETHRDAIPLYRDKEEPREEEGETPDRIDKTRALLTEGNHSFRPF